MRYCYILLLLCFTAALHSCQSGARKQVADRMQEKFDWSPTAGSAYLYPMQIYSCDLIFADGTKIAPVVRTVATPWGEDGRITVKIYTDGYALDDKLYQQLLKSFSFN